MDRNSYRERLEEKLASVTHKPNRNRLASFIFRYAIITAFILSSAIMASGYVTYPKSPEFRQVVKHQIQFVENTIKTVKKAAETKVAKPDYSKKTAQVILARGNALRVKGLYEDAAHAYQASLEKFALKKDNKGLGNVHTEFGILHTLTKKYNFASEQFNRAITYFTLADSQDGLGYANVNLGQLHFVQRQFIKAEKFFLIGEHNYKNSDNLSGLGNTANAFGNLFAATQQLKEAIGYFEQAEALFKSAKNNLGLVNVYNSLRRVSRNQGTKKGDEEANKYYLLAKSIKLNKNTKDLPEFSIRNSFKELNDMFDEHKDIYEGELNNRAKRETEMVVR